MGDTSTDVNASNSLKRPDFNSPFYLHPSENAASTLLPVVFDGTSYRSWRRAVLRALTVKNKTGFINGKIVKPSFTDPSFMQWERCDDMVTSWILNSLSPELRDSLQYVNNAKELWEELEDRYDQTNGCKLYQLQKEINYLVQGTLDITGYYTKMKKLWEEMSAIDVNSQCSCVCTCGGKVKLYKAEKDRRLIHFLMGLNEMYTAVRGNILMMSTLPTIAQAFAILSQEERQREMKPLNHMALESTSLNASMLYQNNATNSSSYRGSTSRGNGSYNNTGSFNNNNTGNFNNTNTYRGNSNAGNRSNMFCEYCKRTRHVKDRCYKLHGYPTNTRNPRGRGKGSAANVHTSEGDGNKCEENFEQGKQMPVNLSKSQYEQLLNLLGNLHGGNESEYTNNVSSGAASLAGYKVLNLATKRIHVSRDVLFYETVLPFVITPAGSSINSILQFLVHYSDKLSCMSSKTNTFIDDEMLNHHTLDEVTCDQVPIPENTPITESTTPPTELNIPVTAPTGPNVSVLTPRRTTRSCHPPSYLKDYNYSLPKLHSSSPINNVVDSQHSLTSFTNHPDHVCFSTLCSESQQLIHNVSHDIEPTSYEESSLNPAWQAAMKQEFDALHTNNTWELVKIPKEKNVIGCKSVYKIKHMADGSIDRFKARLVVKGYTQQAGIDYNETFSPVVKMTTVRTLISLAVKKG
ncbi:uncharacterized protein [Solanum lycopersicum]|uniref:uncharacterized protein n=1 Tax=Solanum lycopersicum TaxID=4081 RepID=UPI0037488100